MTNQPSPTPERITEKHREAAREIQQRIVRIVMGAVCQMPDPMSDDELIEILAKHFPAPSTGGLEEALTDLFACWDVFYKHLPDGEYQGLAQIRAAVNQHREALRKYEGVRPAQNSGEGSRAIPSKDAEARTAPIGSSSPEQQWCAQCEAVITDRDLAAGKCLSCGLPCTADCKPSDAQGAIGREDSGSPEERQQPSKLHNEGSSPSSPSKLTGNCICDHGYASTCPIHGDPNAIKQVVSHVAESKPSEVGIPYGSTGHPGWPADSKPSEETAQVTPDDCPLCRHRYHHGVCGRSDGFTPSGCRCGGVENAQSEAPAKCPTCHTSATQEEIQLARQSGKAWCSDSWHRANCKPSGERTGELVSSCPSCGSNHRGYYVTYSGCSLPLSERGRGCLDPWHNAPSTTPRKVCPKCGSPDRDKRLCTDKHWDVDTPAHVPCHLGCILCDNSEFHGAIGEKGNGE